jgi:hypothetical protein
MKFLTARNGNLVHNIQVFSLIMTYSVEECVPTSCLHEQHVTFLISLRDRIEENICKFALKGIVSRKFAMLLLVPLES